MKKRIAFLIDQFNTVQSGPGRFNEYLRKLDFKGLEITFVSHQVQQENKRDKRVNFPSWLGKLPMSWVLRSYFYAKTLKKLEAEQPFDFILTIDFALGLFLGSDSLRNKLVVMVNDDNYLRIFQQGDHQKGMSISRLWARRLGYFLERRVCKGARKVVANSLHTQTLIEEIYQIPKSSLLLLYKAVDLSWFSFVPRELHPPRKFLFVKNDWKRGGLDLIFKAFTRLSFAAEVEFLVVGISPGQVEEVKTMATNSGFKGKYEVKGLQNRSSLKACMDRADVFINMSRQEALGVSCLEAMASGLPVIASNAGGLKEVLSFGEAGFMIENENVDALVEVLETIHKNPEILQKMALSGKAQAEKFSVERLQINMEALFH